MSDPTRPRYFLPGMTEDDYRGIELYLLMNVWVCPTVAFDCLQVEFGVRLTPEEHDIVGAAVREWPHSRRPVTFAQYVDFIYYALRHTTPSDPEVDLVPDTQPIEASQDSYEARPVGVDARSPRRSRSPRLHFPVHAGVFEGGDLCTQVVESVTEQVQTAPHRDSGYQAGEGE